MLKRLVNKFGIEALIAAGVVLRTDVKCSLDRCPVCDDCDEVPRIHPDPTSRIGYCAYCAKTGEKLPLAVSDYCVLEYSEEGLARRFAAAFGCEGRLARHGDIWHLGKSARVFGRARRDICLVSSFRANDENSRADYPDGIAYLVLAGEIVGEITDPKLRRRVFTFEQLLYLDDDGELAINLDQVELQLLESEGQSNDKPPKLPPAAERIANYYCTQAFALLRLQSWDEIEEAMNKLRPATSLSKTIGVSVAQISRLINLEGKNKSSNQVCQFWYDICTKQLWLNAFEHVNQSYLYDHKQPLRCEGAMCGYQKIAIYVLSHLNRKAKQ